MASLTGEVDLEEGLTAEEKARSLLCATEIEGVLKRYGCKVVTTPIVRGDKVWAEMHVVINQERRV